MFSNGYDPQSYFEQFYKPAEERLNRLLAGLPKLEGYVSEMSALGFAILLCYQLTVQ
jgi:hypothetical protein